MVVLVSMTCVASMALLMYIAAYFVNMFGMFLIFLSRLSLFSLLFIFSSVSSLIYTVLCELRLIIQIWTAVSCDIEMFVSLC